MLRLRKLKQSETFVAAIFAPLVLVLLLVYAIVVHGWLGGASIGGTAISDLMLQIAVILIVCSSSAYLILKYAGKEDISHKSYMDLE